MSNKKFRLKLDPKDLEMQDFEGHMLQENLMNSVKGGWCKCNFVKSAYKKVTFINNIITDL